MWYGRQAERDSKPLLASVSVPEKMPQVHKVGGRSCKRKKGQPATTHKRLMPAKTTGYWDNQKKTMFMTGRSQVSLQKLPICSQLPVMRHHEAYKAAAAEELTKSNGESSSLPLIPNSNNKKKHGGTVVIDTVQNTFQANNNARPARISPQHRKKPLKLQNVHNAAKAIQMAFKIILKKRRQELQKRHLKQFYQEVADAIDCKDQSQCTHIVRGHDVMHQRRASLHSEFATMRDQMGRRYVCRLSAVIDEKGQTTLEMSFLTKRTTHVFDVSALVIAAKDEKERIEIVHKLMSDAKQIHEVQQAATFDELTPVLDKLTFDERMELLQKMKADDYNPGEYVYTQGDSGADMKLLLNGTCTVWQNNQLLHTIQAGSVFGQFTIYTGETRSADVRVEPGPKNEGAHVLSLNETELSDVLLGHKNPDIEKALWNSKKFCRRDDELVTHDWLTVEESVIQKWSPQLTSILMEYLPLNEEIVAKLLERMVLEVVPAKQAVQVEGTVSDEFYFITRGSCDVRVDNKKVASLKKGGYFGAIALLSKNPRKATISTVNKTQFLKCHRKDVTIAMMQHFATKQRKLKQHTGAGGGGWLKKARSNIKHRNHQTRKDNHTRSLQNMKVNVKDTMQNKVIPENKRRSQAIRHKSLMARNGSGNDMLKAMQVAKAVAAEGRIEEEEEEEEPESRAQSVSPIDAALALLTGTRRSVEVDAKDVLSCFKCGDKGHLACDCDGQAKESTAVPKEDADVVQGRGGGPGQSTMPATEKV